LKQIKKYDDDERELDDFYFSTNEKDLQSNRNITPPRSFDNSDNDDNEFFSQTNIEEDIEDEKRETEKGEKEGTTPLPMYKGEADMCVDAELEDNNTSYNYDLISVI